MPDKYWKADNGKTAEDKVWRTGDEINLAIGQGDLLVTPMQMAVAVSAIANGGHVLVPHLGLRITDASGNYHPPVRERDSGASWASARASSTSSARGCSRSPNRAGTAHGAFKGFPIAVAGKTGTAQKLPEDDYALFMAYAPADNPQIAVVAIIEQGGHGSSVAAPVVRRVIEAYFHTGSGSNIVIPTTE